MSSVSTMVPGAHRLTFSKFLLKNHQKKYIKKGWGERDGEREREDRNRVI